MNTRISIATLALLLAAGCFPDVGEGKTRATVSATTAQPTSQAREVAPAAQVFVVDTARSKIAAVGAKVTRKHDIAFSDWSGTLKVAGDELVGVEIEIRMASLTADEPKLTSHLQSPDFFDVATYPTATFAATSIEKRVGGGGETHVVTGAFTMHGVTRELSFPATLRTGAGTVEASADFVINRKDFGIVYPGMPDDLIKDDVALSITLLGGNQDA